MSDTDALLARIDALEKRLAEVEDVQAIHRLKARYGAVTDRRYTGHGLVARDRLEAVIAARAADAVPCLTAPGHAP